MPVTLIIWTLSDVNGCNRNTKIFLGINLSPYFKSLDYHCRRLKKAGKINKCYPNSKGFIKIKMGDRINKITHENVLVAMFPDFLC